MKTTLYNHKSIGTEDKPLIPNAVYKALITLLQHKDYDACNYILKNYTLHPSQLSLYNQTKENADRRI